MGSTFAIVGTGTVATKNYLPFLARQPGATLRYLNRTREKADACARAFSGTVCGSVDELLSQPCDAVFLLTAEQARFDLAQEVLRHAPKRVFFEKPLVAMHGQDRVDEDDFARALALLRAAAAAGTETAMVFNYRFFDQIRIAQRLVDERALGACLTATGYVHWACWSHCLDLIALFAGPFARVTALATPAAAGGSPGVAAAFTTASGASGSVQRVGGAAFTHPLYELVLGFEHGRLHLRGLDGDCELIDYRRAHAERFAPSHDASQWARYEASFARSLAAYLASIAAGAPPPVPGLAGLRELQAEAAIVRSARDGGVVEVERAFPITVASKGHA